MSKSEIKYTEKWAGTVSDAQDLVAMSNEDIASMNDQWEQVLRLSDEGSVDNETMITAVCTGLSESQAGAVGTLMEISRDVPYEDMNDFLQFYEARVTETKTKLASKALELSVAQEKIYTQRDTLSAVVPSLRDTLEDIASVEVANLELLEIDALKAEADAAESDYLSAEELYIKAGEAWPVPRLASVEYERTDQDLVMVDQFPYDRENQSSAIAERVKVMRTSNGRLTDASQYLALLLAEEPGHIWTLSELGAAIYHGEGDTDKSSRVSALLSNYRHNKSEHMNEFFGELTLQKGRRRLFTQEGTPVPRTERVVWRLVDGETAHKSQRVVTRVTSDGTRQTFDEWESIIPGEDQGEHLDASKGLTHEDSDEFAQPALSSEDKPENTFKANEVPITVPVEKEMTGKDWAESLLYGALDAIKRFESLGLMSSPELTWKDVLSRDPSRKAGTKTAREKAFANDIITRSQMEKNASITPTELILCHLMDTNPGIFKVPARRTQAIRIVEAAINDYFKRKTAE